VGITVRGTTSEESVDRGRKLSHFRGQN
jgi:hypothetical protein